MSDERPTLRTARIIHQTPTRTRFRVDGVQDDLLFFRSVAASLKEHPEVDEVVCNPLTSTVLVHHGPALRVGELVDLAEDRDCFVLGEPETRGTPIQHLRKLYLQVDADARRLSQGRLDMESIALGLLLLAAVSGVIRGDIGFPAATAAWYALELVWKRSPREPATNPPDRTAA